MAANREAALRGKSRPNFGGERDLELQVARLEWLHLDSPRDFPLAGPPEASEFAAYCLEGLPTAALLLWNGFILTRGREAVEPDRPAKRIKKSSSGRRHAGIGKGRAAGSAMKHQLCGLSQTEERMKRIDRCVSIAGADIPPVCAQLAKILGLNPGAEEHATQWIEKARNIADRRERRGRMFEDLEARYHVVSAIRAIRARQWIVARHVTKPA